MTDILNVGAKALSATQLGIATTSHNIANAGREDYSRQRLELSSANPIQVGRHSIGRGVAVDGIQRQVDDIVQQQLRESESNLAAYDITETTLNELQSIVADPNAGVQPMVENFYAAAADLSLDPSSSTKRSVLIEAGNSLAARANSIAGKLETTRNSVTRQALSVTNDLNSNLASLEKLNRVLGQHQDVSQVPSDILDQRDQLLKDIGQDLGLNVHENERGQVSLYTQKGHLVLEPQSRQTLSVVRSPLDGSLSLSMRNSQGAVTDIGDSVEKGRLGALIDLGNGAIKEIENGLGRSLYALADSVNELHQQGMKPDGALGGEFFTLPEPQVMADADNSGTGVVTAEIQDLSMLTMHNYTLRRNAADWTLTRDDGTTLTGAGPMLSMDGVQFDASVGVAATGDHFVIRPVGGVSRGLSVAVQSPDQVAASGALRTENHPSNTGTGRISEIQIDDPANANLLDNLSVKFDDPPTTYQVLDATGTAILSAQPFTAGSDISQNGWTIRISGQPQADDEFAVQSNVNGQGDNSVALAISRLEEQKPLVNGQASVMQSLNDLSGNIASRAQTANLNRVAEEGVRDYLFARQQSVSGVNLDEEAANMVRLQQAYQASAQIIRTSQEIFNSLMQAM